MRLVKAALIGFGIAIGILFIPIVHFIAGPVSPAIGGFIGGSKAKAEMVDAVIIGSLMGLFSFIIIIPTLAILTATTDLLGEGFQTFWLIAAILAFLYITMLGIIGAFIGGHMARQPDKPLGDSSSEDESPYR